jgi:hypothetical protein
MVKSPRYDSKNHDNDGAAIFAGRLQRAGYTDAYTNFNGNTTPDSYTTAHGHADTRIDLPFAESVGEMDAARFV